jgi:hypothetical protein
MYNTTRDDVKKLAQEIEALARQVQSAIDTNGNLLEVANELVGRSNTFVFSLGEVYALEQSKSTTKNVVGKVVSNPNYHNVRDNNGRFARKV